MPAQKTYGIADHCMNQSWHKGMRSFICHHEVIACHSCCLLRPSNGYLAAISCESESLSLMLDAGPCCIIAEEALTLCQLYQALTDAIKIAEYCPTMHVTVKREDDYCCQHSQILLSSFF